MNDPREPLLAKGPKPGRPEKTVLGHTRDVLEASAALFGEVGDPTPLGRRWRAFFRLPADAPFDRTLRAAAALHDVGKCGADFQDAVRSRGEPQRVRHEHLSALVMCHPPVRDWLAAAEGVDGAVCLSAVLCHHLKAGRADLEPRGGDGNALLDLNTHHPQWDELWAVIGEACGLAADPPAVPRWWSLREPAPAGAESIETHRRAMFGTLKRLERTLSRDEPRRRLLWAVRAGLIVADAAGSGLPRVGETIGDWVRQTFAPAPYRPGDLAERVIVPRVAQIKAGGGRWRGWNGFQDAAADLPPRALLLAPCGSGKTLAAWRWLDRHVGRADGAGTRNVLFLYPTRATATEGFRDYVSWAPETEAALSHGTAPYELEGLFENPADPDRPADARAGKSFETDARLFALGYWKRRVFSATVDQFLSFTRYGYAGVCSLPLLADAAVVIDEVHAYDPVMFAALLDVLKQFDVPVLCMTATLSEQRRDLLAAAGGPGWELLDGYAAGFADLDEIAEAPRYRVRRVARDAADERVRAALADGRRVLWVANTVARAQSAAARFAVSAADAELETPDGKPVYCYHSRFRLCDRNARHRAVVAAFQPGGAAGGVLAVTTQVCEMGLDLDADLLVTEAAPVAALIQRMGRCNRASEPREGAGDVLVLAPPDWEEQPEPYTRDDLAAGFAFADRMEAKGTANQSDLDEALRQAPPAPDRPADTQFVGGGAFATRADFRDIEQFTAQAILNSDVPAALAAVRATPREPIDGFVVPVPKSFKQDGTEPPAGLPRYLIVAPADHYSPMLGFRPHAVGGSPPPCPSGPKGDDSWNL